MRSGPYRFGRTRGRSSVRAGPRPRRGCGARRAAAPALRRGSAFSRRSRGLGTRCRAGPSSRPGRRAKARAGRRRPAPDGRPALVRASAPWSLSPTASSSRGAPIRCRAASGRSRCCVACATGPPRMGRGGPWRPARRRSTARIQAGAGRTSRRPNFRACKCSRTRARAGLPLYHVKPTMFSWFTRQYRLAGVPSFPGKLPRLLPLQPTFRTARWSLEAQSPPVLIKGSEQTWPPC